MATPSSPYKNNIIKGQAIIHGNENKEKALKKYDDFIKNLSVAEDFSMQKKMFVFAYEIESKEENIFKGGKLDVVCEEKYIEMRDVNLSNPEDVEFILKKFIDNCNPDVDTAKEFASTLSYMKWQLSYENILEMVKLCRESCKNNVSPMIALQNFSDSIGEEKAVTGNVEEISNYKKYVNFFNGESFDNLSSKWIDYKKLEINSTARFSRKKRININKKSGIRYVTKMFSKKFNFNKLEKEIFYKKLKYRVNAVQLGGASFERKSFITTLELFEDARERSYFKEFVNSR